MTTITRRGLITGLVSLVVARPAIVRAASLMSVKAMEPSYYKYVDPFQHPNCRCVIEPHLNELTRVFNVPLRYLLPPVAKTPQEQRDLDNFYRSISLEH